MPNRFDLHHVTYSGLVIINMKEFFVSVSELNFCTLKTLCFCVSGDLMCVK